MSTRRSFSAAVLLGALLLPRLAPAQDAKIATLNLGAGPFTEGPSSIAVDGSNGFAYVYDNDSNDILKVDLTSNIVTAVLPLSAGSCRESAQLAISDLGGGHHHLWVLTSDNQLYVVEIMPSLAFGLITGTSVPALPSVAEDMVVDDSVNTVFLACPSTDQVVAIGDSTAHGLSIAPRVFSPVSIGLGSKPARLVLANPSGAADRLFMATRGLDGLVKKMNTTTGAVGSVVFSVFSPPNTPQDVAFDGDPTSGRIYVSVRNSMGDGIAEIDPVAGSQTGSVGVSGAMGNNRIDDIAAMRITGASKVAAVRGPNFPTDGGASVICTFPQPPTAGPGPVGFTIPAGIELRTSSQSFGGPASSPLGGAGGLQNMAMDPVNQRIYITHDRPFHAHIFDVAGVFLGELNPSGLEEGEDGVVAVATVGGVVKVFVTQPESNFVAAWNSATIVGNPNNPAPDAEFIPPGHINNACLDPTTNKLVVTSTNKDLTVVDLSTHAVSTIALPGPLFGHSGCGVHPSAGYFYVGNGRKGLIHAVNLNTNAITTVNIPFMAGESFAGIAIDKTTGRAYVGSIDPSNPSAGSGSLFVVDTNPASAAFMTVVNTFPITSGGFPCDFEDLTVDRVTGIVYALDAHGLGSGSPLTSRIFKINGSTGAVMATTTVSRTDSDHGPEALAINPTTAPPKLYVGVSANNGMGTTPPSPFIRILDGTTLASLAADIPVASHAHFHGHEGGGGDDDRSLVVEEITGRLYVSIGARTDTTPVQNAAIEVINAANLSETTLAFGPPGTCSNDEDSPSLGLNKTTGRLFAVSKLATSLRRFDGVTEVTTPALSTSTNPEAVRINPTTGRVYVFMNPNQLDVFARAPSISSIAPTSGAVGTSVSITGAGFLGATAVQFGGTTATFSVLNDGSISTSVPTGAATGSVTVVGPAGSASSTSAFTVPTATVTLPPSVVTVSPTSGTRGSTVTVSGSGFTGATAVTFNGVASTFSVSGDTMIFTSVPTGATTGPVAVTTSAGTGSSASSFTVLAPPLATSPGPANPPSNSALAGTSFVPIFQLNLSAGGPNDIDVSGIEFSTFGTGNPSSGLAGTALWLDANQNGFADQADLFVATGSFSSASTTAATPGPSYFFNIPVGPGAAGRIAVGATKTFLLTFDLSSSVSVGQTFSVDHGIFASDVVTSLPVSATASPAPFTSGTLTIGAPATAATSSVSGGATVADFIMFSASIDTGATGFAQIEAQLGPLGSSGNWRLFRFDPSTGLYDEFGETNFTSKYPTMNPAFGWWLIARNAGSLSFTGTSTAVTNPNGFSITLRPGWNQVGNPYTAALPLALVKVNNVPFTSSSNTATLPSLYAFSGGSYFAETAGMQAKQGYWMKNVTGSPVTVFFERPPNALKAGEGVSQTRPLAPGEEAPPSPPALQGGTGLASGGGGGGGGACFAPAGGTGALPWGVLAALGVITFWGCRLARLR